MAYLDATEIRDVLQQRYGMDLEEKISRVEFELPNGERPYFHIADDWQPYIEPEEQHSYVLQIQDGEDVRDMPFKSLQALMTSFASFQRLNQYRLTALEDGEVIQEFIPDKKR